ncbi:hypothetical protein INR49_016379, partial [Caranx melampygus]
ETPLHKMLFLPAAALCCLCSALVAMAAELVQDQLSLTRRVGEPVSFSCEGTELCDYNGYVGWFQKKETFTVILKIHRQSGQIEVNLFHPEKDDFTAVNKQNGCSEARGERVPSSIQSPPGGEELPAVSGLSHVSSSGPVLLEKTEGGWSSGGAAPAEGEQLDLTEPGRSAAILLVDRGAFYTYKYHCYIEHEGGTVKAQTAQVVPLDPLRPQCRVKLLCLLYTVLIVKSLLYCCGLPLLMSLRNKG